MNEKGHLVAFAIFMVLVVIGTIGQSWINWVVTFGFIAIAVLVVGFVSRVMEK